MNLIKAANRKLAESEERDPVKKAINEMFDEVDPAELKRVINFHRKQRLEGRAFIDAVGEDLEALEYSPEAIELALAQLAGEEGLDPDDDYSHSM